MQPTNVVNPFRSFWMGGFECTDQLNINGDRVDFLNITQHLTRIDDDYQQLKNFNINTVREGIRWSFVEKKPYEYDFSTVKTMLDSGKKNNVQQIWDICHFGFPDDLSPLHPQFTKRFASLCRAFVLFYRSERPDGVLIVTPINEVSFISWLGGQVACTVPYTTERGYQVKYALMKAYIQGIYAMKEIDPTVRILTTEPLVNMVPQHGATDEDVKKAEWAHNNQYQALDMLGGYDCPELGGSTELLDLLGFNFYYNNQWVAGVLEFLPWLNEGDDPRWKPLSQLLAGAYNRYKKPIVLTETSHPGEDRDKWIKFIGEECGKTLAMNVPLLGVCLYPIIDRPNWDDLTDWHRSGLWDEDFNEDGTSVRTLHQPYADALVAAQEMLEDRVPFKMVAY
jgi:hypothetical protein